MQEDVMEAVTCTLKVKPHHRHLLTQVAERLRYDRKFPRLLAGLLTGELGVGKASLAQVRLSEFADALGRIENLELWAEPAEL
jgi:hypothetical protein